MKKFFLTLILLLVIFFVYSKNAALFAHFYQDYFLSVCNTPLTYRLGDLDPRFNLTEKQFLQDVDQAAQIWNSAYGKPLLQYDPQSTFPVNMVYDQRQSLNNQINTLDKQLQQQDNNLKPQEAAYKQKAADFDKKLSALNQQIAYWNRRGGAPPAEYHNIITQQADLQQEAQALNQMAKSLNRSATTYNDQLQQLRQSITAFNQEITQKPEEGLYTQNGPERQIDIYFNSTPNELIHTLAHEFGHALNLPHLDNPEAIMYPWVSESLTLSADDLTSLTQVCQQTRFTLFSQQLQLNLNQIIFRYFPQPT